MGKNIVLKVIKFYQFFISANFGRHCRFYPTCSAYTYQAVEKYGIFKGVFKGFWRILKCGPWSRGGVDLP